MDVLEVLGPEVRPLRERKPPWFKVPPPGGARYRELTELIRSENLHTVCQEAACPNVGECWERGTATFMILGDTCTRRCGFCNVQTGKPTWNDPLEPARVARSIARMGLRHAVITSVDRDDLPDKGAYAFVGVIRQIRRQAPDCQIEVLTPDFQGQEMPLAKVIAERPHVFNHNVEVVPRLYPIARRGSEFQRSCRVLRLAGEMGEGEVVTKSGLMVGLGETHEELVETFATLPGHGVQVLTVGQYLRPSERHLPVVRYWHPDEFFALERAAYELGFDHVAAGPLVRSSYHADQHVPQARPGIGPLAGVEPSEPRIVCTDPPLAEQDPIAAMTRTLVLLVALIFIARLRLPHGQRGDRTGSHGRERAVGLHPRAAVRRDSRCAVQSSSPVRLPAMSTSPFMTPSHRRRRREASLRRRRRRRAMLRRRARSGDRRGHRRDDPRGRGRHARIDLGANTSSSEGRLRHSDDRPSRVSRRSACRSANPRSR